MNGVIIQFFHWYHPGNLWNEFADKAIFLKELGFTAVWLPPATKCSENLRGRGYDIYDQYDLGEFDQKGGIPTRYGTKHEYLNSIEKAHEAGLHVYADIVLNHRMGGDEEEQITVHEVSEEDRNIKIAEAFMAKALTKFTFPGRNGKYSEFIWNHQCFSGIDNIKKDNRKIKGIFKIHNEYGEEWNDAVSHQFGNYDYLMGADIEYRNPKVVQEMKTWIKWYLETTKADGIRVDALKHISLDFLKEWISYIKKEINPDLFILGEFWKDEAEKINDFSQEMNDLISCFDAPLHYNFFNASNEGKDYDLRKVLDGSFLERKPIFSVSFVENHDTQRLQSLESSVRSWFKPIAYAIILLTKDAYPCVFYPDLFGAEYTDQKDGEEQHIIMPKVEILPKLMEARKLFAHGEQIKYFDHKNCIAFVRKGEKDHPGCVVIISNSGEGYKEIDLGKEFANSVFRDFLNIRNDEIILDDNGKGIFKVNMCSVSVWIKNDFYSD
ncbi:alpha-amylase [Chryseobacterium wangxinyae]|uniref:alpha-amylase n=1 Tax=Chryseobacterium sp. CY350 TaxID=2997336 RepID=UPI00226FEECA|nr:alpha-amylase [Chryseobacterium sp. CY350]MCY0976775.1 alpha-amylase [Chryseobacterium sp. CY350]WBZ96776.1 alpha-amylase [Chryseobacterium sp. CY350]